MTLREILQMWTINQTFSQKEMIEKGRQMLFDFDYPIFDENYRSVFETHFIRNFYMREIGFETEWLFKFNLESWLNIHMPYFNKLFESELLTYNPLQNTEMNETHNRKNNKSQNENVDTTQSTKSEETTNQKTDQSSNIDGKSHSSNKETSNNHESGSKNSNVEKDQDNFNRKLTSDIPDSRLQLSETDGEGIINYASYIEENSENNKETTSNKITESKDSNGEIDNTNDTTSNVTSSENANTDITSNADTSLNRNNKLTSEINDTEDYIQHYVGKIGSITYPEMVMKQRESFIRIEKMIFKEMNDLFMLIY